MGYVARRSRSAASRHGAVPLLPDRDHRRRAIQNRRMDAARRAVRQANARVTLAQPAKFGKGRDCTAPSYLEVFPGLGTNWMQGKYWGRLMARIPTHSSMICSRAPISSKSSGARAAEAAGQGIRLALVRVPRRTFASFTVSPTKQFYHCFGCGAHGTAISFLMNYDRLEFTRCGRQASPSASGWRPRDTSSATPIRKPVDRYGAMGGGIHLFPRPVGERGGVAYVENAASRRRSWSELRDRLRAGRLLRCAIRSAPIRAG